MKTIKQLAEQFNITTTTIRHYEKVGLLDSQHVTRAKNSYRLFNKAAEARLELVQHGKAAGFTLEELASRIQKWENGTYTTDEQRAIFNDQLARIEQKIAQFEATKAYIVLKLRYL